ncbi:MAG: hypothetical protein HY744_34720, partial [Deltaproteobacteria bacterium]|nr:hypothetical protein [Deltaproteobacteria bacterium]
MWPSRAERTAIRAIIASEIKLLYRDPAALVMLFLLPALFIAVVSVSLQGAFSSTGDRAQLRVVLVDEDGGPLADKLVTRMQESGALRVAAPRRGERVARAAALLALREHRCDLVVAVPKGSSAALRGEGAKQAEVNVQVILDPVISAPVARATESIVRAAVLGASIEALRERLRESSRARVKAEDAARAEAKAAQARAEAARRACASRRPPGQAPVPPAAEPPGGSDAGSGGGDAGAE